MAAVSADGYLTPLFPAGGKGGGKCGWLQVLSSKGDLLWWREAVGAKTKGIRHFCLVFLGVFLKGQIG